MAKRYVSNKETTPRLFSNELIEKLSHVHPTVPIMLFLPVISCFLFLAFNSGTIEAGLVRCCS